MTKMVEKLIPSSTKLQPYVAGQVYAQRHSILGNVRNLNGDEVLPEPLYSTDITDKTIPENPLIRTTREKLTDKAFENVTGPSCTGPTGD